MKHLSEMVDLAKDRAIDDLHSLFLTMPELDRFKIRNILIALTLPKDDLNTLDTFSVLGYWNGEEDTFFEEKKND